MTQIRWLERLTLVLLHAESLAKYGGLAGMRDEGLLEGALAPPTQPPRLRGSRRYHDAGGMLWRGGRENHPFNDGNKRAAFIAALTFARLNGVVLGANQAEAAAIMVAVASNKMDQAELAAWLRQNVAAERE